MVKNNRERQAEFKQRMRDAGKKQITVWVTPVQEQAIRALLENDEVRLVPSGVLQEPKGTSDKKS